MALRRVTAIGLAVSLWLAAGSAEAGPVVDPAREDLARQLVAVIRPESMAAIEVRATIATMRTVYMTTTAYAAGGPLLDKDQFTRSRETGARATLAPNHAALAGAYAQGMSADELRAALAFYRSAEGQTALTARASAAEQVMKYVDRLLAGSGNPAVKAPQYKPSAAEAAFEVSPAGAAMARADSEDVAVDSLQRPIEAAATDYCAHAACNDTTRQFFKFMDDSVASGRARGEHGMFGSTAGDLAPDANAAKLARAACSGNAAGVAAAVKAGADPNSTWKEGVGPGAVREMVTPLLWALDCGNVAGVKALLDAGANPNQVEKFGATPVTVAADSKNSNLLKLLLSRGGDANAHNHRQTALQIALDVANDLERIDKAPKARAWTNWDLLLAAGADPNRGVAGQMSLMDQAAFVSQFEKVEWLYHQGWKGDPVALGRDLEMQGNVGHVPPDQIAAMERVKAELIARGVRFPIGALIKLKRDSNGFLIQP
jgi:hypothetical protein